MTDSTHQPNDGLAKGRETAISLADSEHARASLLLPWHASADLSDTEQALLDQHISSCRACQQELAWLQDISHDMNDQPEPPAAEIDKNFAALMGRIEQESAEQAAINAQATLADTPASAQKQRAPVSESEPSLWQRLREWMTPAPQLVFAQWVVIAGLLGVYLAPGQLGGDASQADINNYELLSSKPIAGQAEGVVGSVVFDSQISLASMQQLLQGFNGRIIDGPALNGVYTVEFVDTAANREQFTNLSDHAQVSFATIRYQP